MHSAQSRSFADPLRVDGARRQGGVGVGDLKSRPVVRKKLSDAVYEQLVALIREEGYKPGDQLPPERDLMAVFDVGRPVVREAMQRLASQGLLSIQHGERARIAQVDLASMFNQLDLPARHLLSESVQNIAHLHEARVFLETGLVKLAVERATPADLERLRAAFAAMRERAGSDDFFRADMAFHIEIARISGNPILLATSRATLQWMADFGRDMLRTRTQATTLDDHGRILERIVARDAAGAEQAMREHLVRD